MPRDRLFDTLDEEEDYSPFISLPGRAELGIGRNWHFFVVIGWILLGLSYYILLFATGQWHRYWPGSWSIFPEAWDDIVTYMTFNLPPLLPGEPLDAMQKLAYAGVVFGLAPFQILTGAAQSPAIEARFPSYVRMWGGRQWARSLHFLGLLAFVVFIVIHLSMVFFWGWGHLSAAMIFGSIRNRYVVALRLRHKEELVVFPADLQIAPHQHRRRQPCSGVRGAQVGDFGDSPIVGESDEGIIAVRPHRIAQRRTDRRHADLGFGFHRCPRRDAACNRNNTDSQRKPPAPDPTRHHLRHLHSPFKAPMSGESNTPEPGPVTPTLPIWALRPVWALSLIPPMN